jgi:hypothetical protein
VIERLLAVCLVSSGVLWVHGVPLNTINSDGIFDGIPSFSKVDTIVPLSDVTVRKAKGAEKAYRLSDEKALYLQVEPNDSKYWRMNYRFEGKQKALALGAYPDVSLKAARERRDEARRLMADGIDPAAAKAAAKASKAGSAVNSFEVIAREWYKKQADLWSPSHGAQIIRWLERDIFP